MPVIVNKRLFNIKAAAEYLSISRSLLYQWLANGKIPSITINTRRLIDVNDLDHFVEKLKMKQGLLNDEHQI